jgi:hypothetical protein
MIVMMRWPVLVGLGFAACGRMHFDPTATGSNGSDGGTSDPDATRDPVGQMVTVAATGDDGAISNGMLLVNGESGINRAGYWTASAQSNWAYFRFRLDSPIPADAIVTDNTRLQVWGADGTNVGNNAVEFTLVNAELAPSTTAPTSTAPIPVATSIYADELGSGWQVMGSTATAADVQSAIASSGANALSVGLNINGGWLTFTSTYHALATTDFTRISFDMNVGPVASANVDAMRLNTLGVTSGVRIADYGAGGHFEPNTWYRIEVPLSDFLANGEDHVDFWQSSNSQASFYLDNLRLEGPAASFRMLTAATVLWPGSGATALVVNNWNVSPSLAPVVQELVDCYGGLAAGSYVTLWIVGPDNGFGYTGNSSYLPGYADYSTNPTRAANLTIEYR